MIESFDGEVTVQSLVALVRLSLQSWLGSIFGAGQSTRVRFYIRITALLPPSCLLIRNPRSNPMVGDEPCAYVNYLPCHQDLKPGGGLNSYTYGKYN